MCACLIIIITNYESESKLLAHLKLSSTAAINCKSPPAAPANGKLNKSAGLTFGSTVTYSCNTGYNPQGLTRVTCMANGRWSGSQPNCSGK